MDWRTGHLSGRHRFPSSSGSPTSGGWLGDLLSRVKGGGLRDDYKNEDSGVTIESFFEIEVLGGFIGSVLFRTRELHLHCLPVWDGSSRSWASLDLRYLLVVLRFSPLVTETPLGLKHFRPSVWSYCKVLRLREGGSLPRVVRTRWFFPEGRLSLGATRPPAFRADDVLARYGQGSRFSERVGGSHPESVGRRVGLTTETRGPNPQKIGVHEVPPSTVSEGG